MCPRRNARADDDWWVESAGYEEQLGKSLRVRKAKDKLQDVLAHYGLDVVLPSAGWKKVNCPFHDDRHPSASVSQRSFKCFTCGTTGDAISLVMLEENLSFLQAVDMILTL